MNTVIITCTKKPTILAAILTATWWQYGNRPSRTRVVGLSCAYSLCPTPASRMMYLRSGCPVQASSFTPNSLTQHRAFYVCTSLSISLIAHSTVSVNVQSIVPQKVGFIVKFSLLSGHKRYMKSRPLQMTKLSLRTRMFCWWSQTCTKTTATTCMRFWMLQVFSIQETHVERRYHYIAKPTSQKAIHCVREEQTRALSMVSRDSSWGSRGHIIQILKHVPRAAPRGCKHGTRAFPFFGHCYACNLHFCFVGLAWCLCIAQCYY